CDGGVAAFRIDAATGALTAIDADSGTAGVQNFNGGFSPSSVAVHPAGRFLYVADYDPFGTGGGIAAFRVDAVTGALSPIDAHPVAGGIQEFAAGLSPISLAVDPSGSFVYAAVGAEVVAFAIDSSTVALPPA